MAKVTPRSGSKPISQHDDDEELSVDEIADELMAHSHPVPDAKVAFGAEQNDRISLTKIRQNSSKRKSMIQLLDLIDTDGDGYLEASELLETIKILKSEKGKVKNLKYTVIGLVLLVVLSFAMMLVTSVLGSELAKDQIPDDTGVLMTKTGHPVKTEVTSMHLTLMDIPKFGREQLSKLHTIDLDTDVGLMSLQITGYLAQQGKQVTLFTSMAGTEVMIDAQAGTAVVSLKGNTVSVKTGSEQITRRALLADKAQARCFSNGACLFERHELRQLFGTHDAQGRRLQATDGSYSFVTINTAELSTEDSLDALIKDAAAGAESDVVYGTAQAGDIEIKFEQIAGTNRIQAALGNMRWLHTDTASYTFEGMTLVGCADSGSFFPNVASVLNNTADVDVVFQIKSSFVGVTPSETFIVPTPEDSECQELFLQQYPDLVAAAAESDVAGRRLMPDGTHEHALHHNHAQMLALNNHIKMFSNTPEFAEHLQYESEEVDSTGRKLLVASGTINSFANMGQDVYSSGCNGVNYDGWKCSDYRAVENAFAWYVTNGAQCGFVVRGSDDLQDWISNLVGAFSRTNVCGKSGCMDVHRGFGNEFNKLKPFFQQKISGGCSNPHWSGHSLGGAVASIGDYVFGGTSVVFASPKPFAGKVHVNDYRLFHEDDAVSGKMFGFMSSLDHGGGGSVKQIVCGSQKCNWWGWSCKCVNWKLVSAGPWDDSGTMDNPFGTLPAHSIGNMVWALVKGVWNKWG